MKRYTIRFRPGPSVREPGEVRASLEKHLLNLPITFRLGAAEMGISGEAVVELATDSGIEDLKSKLAAIAGPLSSTFLSVDWGWQLSSGGDGAAGLDPEDPFPAGPPLSDVERLDCSTRGGIIRALGSLLILPAIVVLPVIRANFPDSDLGFLVAWSVLWFSFALAAASNPWSLVRTIQCGREALEIRFWMRGRRTIRWEQITGLDVHPEQLTLRLGGRKVRVATPGIPHRERLVAFIRDRSRLWFVQAVPPANATYRRSDSP